MDSRHFPNPVTNLSHLDSFTFRTSTTDHLHQRQRSINTSNLPLYGPLLLLFASECWREEPKDSQSLLVDWFDRPHAINTCLWWRDFLHSYHQQVHVNHHSYPRVNGEPSTIAEIGGFMKVRMEEIIARESAFSNNPQTASSQLFMAN